MAGRHINDSMGKYIAEQTVKQVIGSGNQIKGAKVIVLGLTFKENVPDLRNSRVIDVINELKSYGMKVFVHDPVPCNEDARHEYDIELLSWEELPVANAMVAAVAHRTLVDIPSHELAAKVIPRGCFVDVKSAFDADALRKLGLCVWRL